MLEIIGKFVKYYNDIKAFLPSIQNVNHLIITQLEYIAIFESS